MENDTLKTSTARHGSPFLSTKEACRYLGLSYGTLLKMRMGPDGPPWRKHGRAVRYHISDLDAWSEKGRRLSTSEDRKR